MSPLQPLSHQVPEMSLEQATESVEEAVFWFATWMTWRTKVVTVNS